MPIRDRLRDRAENWAELFRSLIEALIEVLGAQVALIKADWEAWSKRVGLAAALAAAAVVLLLSTLVLVVVLVVVLFELWLGSLWKALLLTIGLVLLVVTGLLLAAWLRVKSAGDPVALSKERIDEHARWWHEKVLHDEPLLDKASSREEEN